ncbi:hypothetical protein MNBD_GAMMA01-1126 [hydrothermal vent metagenome]|uniref:Rhs-family protein n=1 Tax=hydrothermal vent metagenome TaxID=652676 RepID=A0A3B0WCT1_9ZZZZ
MINHCQQLSHLHYQYIYCIYYKLLCLQYLQNLSSVFCHPTSVITGNITNKNTEHGNYTYGYDDVDRLTSADYPTLTDEIFTYDALGNRKTDSNTGITQWLYNQNNQLLNSVNNQFTYDANGSQIEEKDASGQLEKQYIYNTENRLAEIKDASNQTIATYYYDPFGRRLSKTITNPDATTTTTYFHYNDEGYSAEKTNGQITSYLFSPKYN